ncbi:surface-adhesin E family protein [Burkholderia gladioli]|uniref:surface-adhesin E family protein n=1 Tax=Burkholderia gladioli TaxID=28095 RepID=UPI00163E2468|nr:surface-adhesin E family protein [Burkholderia gladioli]
MKMKKIAAGAALLALLNSYANATHWIPVEGDPGFGLFFDPSSIRSMPDGRRKVWFLKSYPEVQPANGAFVRKPYQSTKELEIFDCKQGTFIVGMTMYYSDAAGNGEISGAFQPQRTPAPSEMLDSVPGSISEAMLKVACSNGTVKPSM